MSMQQSHDRPGKILVAMLKLSGGTTRFLKYEDIVVKAFEMFPEEFALRGHPEFPDSSDIRKPLYSVLKRKYLVRATNRSFALTQLGVEAAEHLIRATGGVFKPVRNADRMSQDAKADLVRMLRSDAYKLFVSSQCEKILDTDFFVFLGCTFRTNSNDVSVRVVATENALSVAQLLRQPDADTAQQLVETWRFLAGRFQCLTGRKATDLCKRISAPLGRPRSDPSRVQ